MMVLWAALGALAGSASVFLLARGARRLVETASLRAFLAGAMARVAAITLLGVSAFALDPANGAAFLVGLTLARIATVHVTQQRWAA